MDARIVLQLDRPTAGNCQRIGKSVQAVLDPQLAMLKPIACEHFPSCTTRYAAAILGKEKNHRIVFEDRPLPFQQGGANPARPN